MNKICFKCYNSFHCVGVYHAKGCAHRYLTSGFLCLQYSFSQKCHAQCSKIIMYLTCHSLKLFSITTLIFMILYYLYIATFVEYIHQWFDYACDNYKFCYLDTWLIFFSTSWLNTIKLLKITIPVISSPTYQLSSSMFSIINGQSHLYFLDY